MNKWKKFFYGIMSMAGLALFFISMMPVFVGVINVGVIIPALVGIAISLYSLLSLKYPMENIPWKREQTKEYLDKLNKAIDKENQEPVKFRKTLIMGAKNKNLDSYESGIENYVPGMLMSREKRVIIDRVVWILVVFGVVVTVAISGIMINGYEKYDDYYRGQTVLVLGAKVNGNEPSRTLKDRLEKACEILEENPEAKCIVAGGKGSDEIVAEAKAMKRYLVDKGIEEDRIFEEDKSVNTEENIAFSLELAQRESLNQEFIIVTQGYHLYRANRYARDIGIESYGAKAETQAGVAPAYWMREVLAVLLLLANG